MSKNCPKCKKISTDDEECSECGVVFADIRGGRGTKTEIDLQCAWNDHGYRCELKGCVSESTNGSGPWYCSDHFWYGLKGWKRPKATVDSETGELLPPKVPTYRERWYAERGLPYEPPKPGNFKAPVKNT